MDTPKTMAMKINETNWSVAAALCPEPFSRKHQANFFGRYVIINVISTSSTKWNGTQIVLRNELLDEVGFNKEYSFMPGEKLKNRFVEVEQIIKLERPRGFVPRPVYARPL